MTTREEEEELLRSVALKNASAIQLARQRAGDALHQAKAELEEKTKELGAALSLMRATLEATGDAILVTNSQGQVTHFNEQYLQMWEVPQNLMQTGLHRKILEFTSQRLVDPGAFLAQIENIYQSSDDIADELRLSDGRIIERVSKIQYVDGRPAGRVWSFRDITSRRQADELRFRLAAVVESSDDAIVSKTLDGIIRTWNTGAERMFGYRADEVVGKHVTMLFPADRLNEEDAIIARLKRGEPIDHYESVRLRRDGTPIPVSLTVSPVKDGAGNIIGASKIARDISERKHAEELQNRLAAVVHFSDDAIISKTIDGIITTWNAGAERIFGYTAQETVGKPVTMLFPPDRIGEEAIILDRLRRGEHIEHHESERVRKDGQKIIVSLTVSPIKDSNGDVIGASKIARDVTEQTRVSEALRRSEE
ncbi:MAG: PAS domain S-box protein, partial [Burkholderiales bacterium]